VSDSTDNAEFKSGFACFVGRPNAGKSTLTNALVGTKVAITSDKPQTTRHTIRGIVHRPDAQLVIVDTPGMHKPRTLLGQRLNDLVHETWAEVEVVGFCVPADQKVGPGDKYILGELEKVARKTPIIGIVTKTDLVKPPQVIEQLLALQRVWTSPRSCRARPSTASRWTRSPTCWSATCPPGRSFTRMAS
jgi:GTP-binding protein Era